MDSKYYKEALEEYKDQQKEAQEDIDQWDKRINKTGCSVENMALQLCHADTNDWRQCLNEMALFKKCWASMGNNERAHTVDNTIKETTTAEK